MQLLIRMVALGLGAWDMIDSQQFKEPKLVSVSRCLCWTFEPQDDKTNEMTCAQQRLRSAWAFAQSDQSLRCAL